MGVPRTAKAPTRSPDQRFRQEIASAVADGASPADMTLRLTLQDTSLLARDRTTPVADIRYQDGVMYFLGVRVQAGGVGASSLDVGAA